MTGAERAEIQSIADEIDARMDAGADLQYVVEQALARLDELLGTEPPRAVRA